MSLRDAFEIFFDEGIPIVTWWFESPDAGHRDCICSFCYNQIHEGEFPVRLFGYPISLAGIGKRANSEMRFHLACWMMAMAIMREVEVVWKVSDFEWEEGTDV